MTKIAANVTTADGALRQVSNFPDVLSIGVWLRTIVAVDLGAALIALVDAGSFQRWGEFFLEYSWRLQPVMLVTLTLLAASDRWLRRLSFTLASAMTCAGTALVTLVMEALWRRVGLSDIHGVENVLRLSLIASCTSGIVLGYFALRAQAMRPAVDAAQVVALTARIRPHFLFNSLNAVLALIRKDPQRAERTLEGVAELYRVLMRDPRDLVPLSEEISLARQYLEIERLRLGDRLSVDWRIEDVPEDALVPPLMLQPLLENAVYYGIEPADDGGEVVIGFFREGRSLRIEIDNTVPDGAGGEALGSGNRMAQKNIAERLALHFDVEASLQTVQTANSYRVVLRLPLGGRV